jgi:ribosomal protein L37AE/L43A
MSKDREFLHNQLIKLGDMMGDGLHYEPGGEWINKEYKKVARALGYGPKRKNDSSEINARMAERVSETPCKQCGGTLRQTRSGSMRAKCQGCGTRFQLLKRGKKP